MLTQLKPHLLDTVRDVVQAKMPDLLEVLLQQEIDKLKKPSSKTNMMPKSAGADSANLPKTAMFLTRQRSSSS